MKVRVEFGNPYRGGLLRVAFDQGRRARRTGTTHPRPTGCSDRTWFALQAGYQGRGWHRSPSGQVKWHRGRA